MIIQGLNFITLNIAVQGHLIFKYLSNNIKVDIVKAQAAGVITISVLWTRISGYIQTITLKSVGVLLYFSLKALLK